MTRSLDDELRRLGRYLAQDRRVPASMADPARERATRSAVLHYRLRLTGAGAATVVAVAGLGLGAMRYWPDAHEPGTGGPHGAGGTIDIRWDDRSLISPFDTLPECGAPAPTPLTSSEGISLSIYEGEPGVLYSTNAWGGAFPRGTMVQLGPSIDGVDHPYVEPRLEDLTPAAGTGSSIAYDPASSILPISLLAAVTSTRDASTSALVSQPGFIVVQDGAIVGYMDASTFGTLAVLGGEASVVTAGDAPSSVVEVCSEGTTALGALPIGDYQLYEVVTVTASPAVAALAARWQIAPVENDFGRVLDPALTPGTWECTDITSGNPPSIIECDPKVTINFEDGTVRLPYPAGSYNDDYRVTLVSGPRDYSVVSDRPVIELDWVELTFPDAPSCGATYDMNGVGEGIGLAIPLEHLWPEGSELGYTAQVMPPEGARSGTVTAAGSFDVWVSRVFDVNREDNPTYWANQHEEIVGYAQLTLNGGAPVAVDRSSGPAFVPATISGLEWCPGAVRGGDGGVETRVYILGSLTWDDGTGPIEIRVSENVDHSSWT